MNPICTFRAPEELRRILKEAAQERGITMNALMLQILWDWTKDSTEGKKHDVKRDSQL